MEYITTKEASAKWGISTIRITVLANEGRIPGAQRLGRSWLIPAAATKPQEYKPNRSGSAKKKAKDNNFSFPLYHFRPDWIYIKKEQLSDQQQQLLLAESAVMECRFADAYPILEDILRTPDDIVTETGALWNAGICCIGLNKPNEFSKIFLRLQLLLSEEFPNRNDLAIVLDILNTYTETIDSSAQSSVCNTDVHEQCLPLACLQNSYRLLTKEVMNPGACDTASLELNLRFLKNTGSLVVAEMLHLHLLGIYFLRHDISSAEKHAKQAVQIAFENKYYFPLATYNRYASTVLSPILEQYPKEFQDHCNKLFLQYEENFSAFYSSIDEDNILPRLNHVDFPYLYAVLMNLPNEVIAERMNVSTRTVKRRLEAIFQILGVTNKKELKEFLKNTM